MTSKKNRTRAPKEANPKKIKKKRMIQSEDGVSLTDITMLLQ